MIYLFSGTPGSGKSLHTAKLIYQYLNSYKDRIIFSNFEINLSNFKHSDRYIYIPNKDLNVKTLEDKAFEFFETHKRKEGSLVLFLDECQILFNSRSWNDKSRMDWLTFFSQHRKFCYDVYLIAQYDIMIDKQFRTLIEYETIHRKITNIGFIGFLLKIITFGDLFLAVTKYYQLDKKVDTTFFKAHKKYYSIYDTFAVFDSVYQKKNEV